MLKNNRVLAHERAGNHFLMESINSNFITTGWHKPHKMYNPEWNLEQYDVVIHIVRNGLDNLAAMYHWLSWQPANKKLFHGLTFQQYIRGIPGASNLKGTDPIKFWCDFADSYYGKIYTVRYEDLHRYPIKVLENIEKKFSLKRKNKELKPQKKLVGHGPRKGIIGDYKNHFNEQDLNYFWSKAESTMNKYGYYRKGKDLELGGIYENI